MSSRLSARASSAVSTARASLVTRNPEPASSSPEESKGPKVASRARKLRDNNSPVSSNQEARQDSNSPAANPGSSKAPSPGPDRRVDSLSPVSLASSQANSLPARDP